MDILLSILAAVGLILGIMLAIAAVMLLCVAVLYESVFGRRFEIYDSPLLPDLNDYPFLENDPVVFPSKRGYKYTGSFYYKKAQDSFKGLIVISHGLFDGHLNYLPEIAYFAERGYKVFAFDNTGSHLSGGKSLRGLPQSAEDLVCALQYLEKENRLPLYLFGHSWGGYAVSAVSCYRLFDIKKVFVQSGFNRSSDMLLEEGMRRYGRMIGVLSSYIRLYEKLKYGKAAGYTARQGIAAATAAGTQFLILHSTDDRTIGLGNSVLANVDRNEKVTLITEKEKGHNSLDSDKAIAYRKKLDGKCSAQLGRHPSSAAKREFYAENADKRKYFELDARLMKRVADFYGLD